MSKDNTEKKELMERIGDYIGCVCQVMGDDNKVFFIGRIETYISGLKEMKIGVYKGESTPTGVLHNTPVKVNIANHNGIIIIHGVVTGQTEQFWRIDIEDIVKREEKRDSFRQMLDCKADIIEKDEQTEQLIALPCNVIDISLNGLAFRSDARFEENDKIIIDNLVLNKDAPVIYNFKCVVRRVFEDENKNTCYGCEFERVPQFVESKLFKDILYLQSKSIKRN